MGPCWQYRQFRLYEGCTLPNSAMFLYLQIQKFFVYMLLFVCKIDFGDTGGYVGNGAIGG